MRAIHKYAVSSIAEFTVFVSLNIVHLALSICSDWVRHRQSCFSALPG